MASIVHDRAGLHADKLPAGPGILAWAQAPAANLQG